MTQGCTLLLRPTRPLKVHDIARASARIDALSLVAKTWRGTASCNSREPLLYARSRVVHAAASIGVDAIDVPFLDLDDPEGWNRAMSCPRPRVQRQRGSSPQQISILNNVFTPDAERGICRARSELSRRPTLVSA